MDLVIGIGQEGTRLAKALSAKAGLALKLFLHQGEKGSFFVKTEKTLEEQEAKFKEEEAKTYLKGYNSSTKSVFVALSGREKITAVALKILKQIQKAKITILFIRDSSAIVRKTEKLHERALFGVLQEYTRSGLFNEMIIVDMKNLSDLVKGTSLTEYHNKRNEILVSSLHWALTLREQESMFEPLVAPEEPERILTFGIANFETQEEKLFYNLTPITNKSYLFLIKRDSLENDGSLLGKIGSMVQSPSNECMVSHGVYPSSFESNFVYILCYTCNIQDVY